jgi:hypothetical protein
VNADDKVWICGGKSVSRNSPAVFVASYPPYELTYRIYKNNHIAHARLRKISPVFFAFFFMELHCRSPPLKFSSLKIRFEKGWNENERQGLV